MKFKQLSMNIYRGQKGGRRPGSGRKRIHSKGVAHRSREKVNKRTPLHINFKFRSTIKNKFCLRLLKRAILNARSHDLRVIHFSLQHNHVHLIVECENNYILTKGMRSLTVTFAKGLKMGHVQLERYHLHVLKSIRETKNAVNYVLFNKQKHEKGRYSKVDEYSSLLSMDGAIGVIKKYARNNSITLHLLKSETWKLSREESYLLKRAINLLTSS